MLLRAIVLAVIAWLLVAAIVASIMAKPLNAATMICNPVLVPHLHPRVKRIQRV